MSYREVNHAPGSIALESSQSEFEKGSAWTATACLHEAFFGGELLSPREAQASGVQVRLGFHMSPTARRLEIRGELDGREVAQTLTRDRFDNFHLSTTPRESGPGNGHAQADIRFHSPPEAFDVIEESLFMQALASLVASRQMR